MLHIDTHSETEPELEISSSSRLRYRLAMILWVVVIILLLAFIPPLINVSRFQSRIARNISASIGRPVHFGQLSVTLLPSLGFTLENFVVDEDPAFGYEPILRADEVHATLRLASLWRGHPEFSTISFGDGASVNLVHLSNGRWNIEPLLFQASHIPAAPTAQRHAGPAPRFPYIEATAARVNLKLDQDKTPFSLDQADFALWEPESNQWHLRLTARPVRTDSSPSETGTVRIEGTLGSPNQTASSLAATPIDLHGDWRDAQLGGLSQFIMGNDAGLRGDISASFTLQGRVDLNTITTDISIRNAGRADFVPPTPLSLEARCQAHAGETFHAFAGITCYWPPPDSAETSTLILAAEVPDVRTPETASVRVTLPAVPASTFFGWLSVASRHPPVALAGPGTLSGELLWGQLDNAGTTTSGAPGLASETRDLPPRNAGTQPVTRNPASPASSLAGVGSGTRRAQLESEGAGAFRPLKQPPAGKGALAPGLLTPSPSPSWTGELEFSAGAITLPDQPPIPLEDIVLQSPQPTASNPAPPHDSFDLQPVSLELGGKAPAILTGHVDDSGYTLHLSGTVLPSRLLAVGKAVPQFGDGLSECLPTPPEPVAAVRSSSPAPEESPIPVDLTATRTWGSPQSWCPAQAAASPENLSSPPPGGKPPQVPATK